MAPPLYHVSRARQHRLELGIAAQGFERGVRPRAGAIGEARFYSDLQELERAVAGAVFGVGSGGVVGVLRAAVAPEGDLVEPRRPIERAALEGDLRHLADVLFAQRVD